MDMAVWTKFKNINLLSFMAFFAAVAFLFILIMVKKHPGVIPQSTVINFPSKRILLKHAKVSTRYTQDGMIVVITSSDPATIGYLYNDLSDYLSNLDLMSEFRELSQEDGQSRGLESIIVKLNNGIFIKLKAMNPRVMEILKEKNLFSQNMGTVNSQ